MRLLPRMSRQKGLLISAFLLALALLAILMSAFMAKNNQLGGSAETTQTPRPTLDARFSLITETGAPVTEQNYVGRFRLVYFGFSFCPDVCPMQLQVVAQALDLLAGKNLPLTPLFISLDPSRDTPEILTDYTDLFHPDIIGLTGTEKSVRRAAHAFKVYFAQVEDAGSQAGYTVDHSSIVYLLSPDNNFLKAYTHRDTAENMAQDILQQIKYLN